MEGEGPGADDADEGVAGQGVGDGGQGPDGQVPPAGFGGDGVHEHAGGDGGQVQRPGAERAAAVQGQGDAEAGEDQGGGVRDGGFQGGDGGRWRAASAIRYWAVKLTAAAAAASTHSPAAALRSHRPDRSGAGREAGGVPVSRVVARDGSVRARGKTGARARAPVVRCVPRRPAPVAASRARGPGTMAGTEGADIPAGWRDLRR